MLAAKLADYGRLLADADVVILSDYGKGGLTHIKTMIEQAHAAGKRVLVDPKGDDYTRYRRATLLTPNRAELRDIVGQWQDEADLVTRAQRLRTDLALEALLVTRSEEGMTLFTAQGAQTIPAQAREVYDVSGAGDTVIATLGVLLAAGATLPDAVRIANEAAGVVVGKLGTAVVQPGRNDALHVLPGVGRRVRGRYLRVGGDVRVGAGPGDLGLVLRLRSSQLQTGAQVDLHRSVGEVVGARLLRRHRPITPRAGFPQGTHALGIANRHAYDAPRGTIRQGTQGR